MSAPLFDADSVRKTISVLVEPGNVFEIRAVNARLDGNKWKTGPVSGFFNNADAAVAALANITSATSIYISLNPVIPDLLARRSNRLDYAAKDETTSDQHIARRRWLLIDCDPERAAGISASDAELKAAIKRTEEVEKFLSEHGWPQPIKAASGNGGHLDYRIDLPADDDGLISRVLTGLKARFSDTLVKVDETVANAARITKLYGTRACKGDSIPDRPHRMSGLVEVPDALGVVSREQLEALASELTPAPVSVPKDPVVLPSITSGSRFDLQEFFQRHGIAIKETRPESRQTIYVLEQCPFDSEHGGHGEVAVFEQASGELGFKCHHNGCADKHWRDFRQHFEPDCYQKKKKKAPAGPRSDAARDAGAAEQSADGVAQGHAPNTENMVVLPGNGISITHTANTLFARVAPTNTLFQRGGVVVELTADETGNLGLHIIDPAAARSRLERYATFFAWRSGGKGESVLKPTIMAEDMARALLESEAARTMLPPIAGLVNCPVITTNGTVIGRGYHAEQRLLITGGEEPAEVALSEAVGALLDLVAEFDFQTPGDKARALASFITPALKLGGHLHGNVPVDVAEADKSQSGKTFRQRIAAAIYNEIVVLVTSRVGGVGSVDETFNAKLIAGHPFIQLDNYRGKFDSPHIEAFLTAERRFGARTPHRREVEIDPSRFFVLMTSNGVETTRDFANRASIVRIRKREGHVFRQYPEGNLLSHVRGRQPYYLGCVFAIIRAWIAGGCQKTNETRHDFSEWATALDWIVQNLLGVGPLMDGHQSAQERVSNPALTFLRKLALAVVEEGRLGENLIASQLYEIAEAVQLDIPGLREPDEDRGKRVIGGIMARLFKEGNQLEVDGFVVRRSETETERKDGRGGFTSKTYRFDRIGADASKASNASKGLNVVENSSIFPEDINLTGVAGIGEPPAPPSPEATGPVAPSPLAAAMPSKHPARLFD